MVGIAWTERQITEARQKKREIKILIKELAHPDGIKHWNMPIAFINVC